jgi:SAM-dependent methyltransferase
MVAILYKLYRFRIYIQYYATVIFYRLRYPYESVFCTIYKKRTWGGRSASGGGSDLLRTISVRQALPTLLHDIGARTVLDAPCGDFHWMAHVSLGVDSYIGVDIVPEVISQNKQKYETKNVRFFRADITRDELPQTALILCRDCMVHLSYKDIFLCLHNFRKSGSTYILATTYPGQVRRNWNIVTGMWRPLDLQLPPFNFPEPLQLLRDGSGSKSLFDRNKYLGLWKIEELLI